jgi:hypothetical protein
LTIQGNPRSRPMPSAMRSIPFPASSLREMTTSSATGMPSTRKMVLDIALLMATALARMPEPV